MFLLSDWVVYWWRFWRTDGLLVIYCRCFEMVYFINDSVINKSKCGASVLVHKSHCRKKSSVSTCYPRKTTNVKISSDNLLHTLHGHYQFIMRIPGPLSVDWVWTAWHWFGNHTLKVFWVVTPSVGWWSIHMRPVGYTDVLVHLSVSCLITGSFIRYI